MMAASRSRVKSKTDGSGEETIRSTDTAHEKCDSYIPNVVVNIPPIDNTEATEANRIARNNFKLFLWSIIVNGSLCITTISLAIFAYTQSDSAKDAATTAKKTLEEVHKYDSTSMAHQDSASASADRYSQNMLDVQQAISDNSDVNAKNNIRYQVKSIKETRKEFDEANEPYLEIEACKIDIMTMWL
jgi:hypothetical protein